MFFKNEKLKGAALMVSACAVFGLMASLIKLVAHIDAFVIGLWRFVVGLALLSAAALSGAIRLKFNNRRLLFTRGFLGGAGIVITILAILNIGMSKGMVLASTYPLFAFVLSMIVLKEKPTVVSAFLIVIAFAGICLVITPNNGSSGFLEDVGFYEILALSVGLIGGLVVVAIRKLHETDSSYAIFFSQCAAGFCMAVIPAGTKAVTVTPADAMILLLIGIAASAGQLMMTQSYKYLPVRTGATLAMLEPVFCYFAGLTFFGELVTFKSLAGTILIIGACIAVVLHGIKPLNSR